LSRLNTSQIVIFFSTFLLGSIAANVMLYVNYADQEKIIYQQNRTIINLERAAQSDQVLNQTHENRLASISGQHQELVSIVKSINDEFRYLNRELQKTESTAILTQDVLTDSLSEFTELKTNFEMQDYQFTVQEQNLLDQQKSLESALMGLKNQSRLLKSSTIQRITNDAYILQDEFSKLSVLLHGTYSDVSFIQTSLGSGVIDIPLSLLFDSDVSKLDESAEGILQPIVRSFLKLPNADITVTGHSDGNPVQDDLSHYIPSNWELSSIQAGSVVRKLIEFGINEQQLTVASRAHNAPIRVEGTEEAGQINRRIEIKISL